MAYADNKSKHIRRMLAKGKAVKDIVKATGASPSYVYSLKAKQEKEPKPTPAPQPAAQPQPKPTFLTRLVKALTFWR